MNKYLKQLQKKEKHISSIPTTLLEDVELQLRALLAVSGGVRMPLYLTDTEFSIFRIDYEDHTFIEARSYQELIDKVKEKQPTCWHR